MTDERDRPEVEESDADRDAILARRRQLVRRSMATLGTLVLAGATGCAQASPCLSVEADASDVVDAQDADAAPMPCLSPEPPDAMDAPEDDGAPMPCLSPEPPDAMDADERDGGMG